MYKYIITNDINSSSAILRAHGPDANTYVQGQFTQDIKGSDGRYIHGLWLNQKGKVVGDSQIYQQGANDFLIVSFSLSPGQLRTRLEAYLIADEVELEDQTAHWLGVLLWGEGAGDLSPPAGTLVFPSRRAGQDGVQWLVPMGAAEGLDQYLKRNGGESGEATEAELRRLRAGVPAIPIDIGPLDLPNEGGLDEHAISYTKGCYLGQEVMARLKNLGQVRRRLHVVEGEGGPPPPGTLLYQGERKLGEIRSGTRDGGNFIAMAMLSLVNLDAGAGLAVTAGGPADIRILRRV